jgi:hypothetical protein
MTKAELDGRLSLIITSEGLKTTIDSWINRFGRGETTNWHESGRIESTRWEKPLLRNGRRTASILVETDWMNE